ncbi:MAG TPA: glycine oxidase ThiO [Pyrinomonadaceae bacterium]|nr:glycine oxidase ThiO [Pyrinomonadaceae bacterium]
MVQNDRDFTRQSAAIVVIGGGVIGLSIARALALRGASDICLIERSRPGQEASFAAAGMLAPQAEANARDDFFTLASRSRDMYANFAALLREETGTDIELDTSGTLYLALNYHDLAEIEKRHQWQTAAGLPVEKLTPAEARELEPCISNTVVGALRFPLDMQVENRRLLSALTNSVVKLGVTILTETGVETVKIEKDRVTGVQTSRGFISCGKVVVAAGTWSSSIAIDRKSAERPPVKIEPIRGQMISFDARPQLCRHVIYTPRGYIVPRRDGRLLAGSTSEDAGFAKHVTAGGIGAILAHAQEISPAIANLPIVDTWAGLRPRAPDNLPLLGPCDEIGGLFYATGHYRNGILLAPITGELIAEAVVEGVLSPLLGPFSPSRFDLVRA